MALSIATVTGKTGAGTSMTAQLFTNVRDFAVDLVREILTITDSGGVITPVSIGLQTTFTVTINATTRTYAITVS